MKGFGISLVIANECMKSSNDRVIFPSSVFIEEFLYLSGKYSTHLSLSSFLHKICLCNNVYASPPSL